MNGLLSESVLALKRWIELNSQAPIPSVALYLRGLDEPLFFSGIAVAPSGSPECFAVSGIGYGLPIYIVRESEVDRIVIGDSHRSRIGFAQDK